jgi:hypothetical protein
MSRWSSVNCPNFKLGHLSKLGQKKRSKINAVHHVSQVSQLARAPVRVREQRERDTAPAYDFHFKLGQLGQLGQRIEIANEFSVPTSDLMADKLGQLGHPGHGSFPPQNRMRDGVARPFASERP